MTDQANSVLRPWRRYLRFSVRGLIVAVLLVGGWLGWIVRSARIHREAVVAVENAGGRVFYDSQCTDHWIKGGEPWAPRWLVALVGVDYFHHPTVAAIAAHPGGEGMLSVGRLTSLEELLLFATEIDDADLAKLKGLTDLSKLNLGGALVSDAGVRELQKALPRLKIIR